MTKQRKLILTLEVETDIHLNLIRNLWGWRCCDRFVRVTKITAAPTTKTKATKK